MGSAEAHQRARPSFQLQGLAADNPGLRGKIRPPSVSVKFPQGPGIESFPLLEAGNMVDAGKRLQELDLRLDKGLGQKAHRHPSFQFPTLLLFPPIGG